MTNSNDAQTSSKHAVHTVKSRRISSILLAFIAIGAIGYALYTNYQLHQQIQMLSLDAQSIKQQQADANDHINLLQTTLQTSNDKVIALDKTLQSAMQQRWYQVNDWLMLKARYYLELATINANWSNDVHTTSALLLQADTLLANLHDQRLFTVRQSIAKEIMQLNSVSIVDIAGLLSQVDAAQHSIATLPIKNAAIISKQADTMDRNNLATSSTWRDRLKQSLNQLKKLVIIRHHDEAIQPLFTTAYETMLRETIRLNLQAAQWAVLQNNPAVYQLSLTQAIDNIKSAFDLDATSTQVLMNQLKQLQQIQIIQQKIIPDESLPLLNRLIDTKQAPDGNINTPVVGAPS